MKQVLFNLVDNFLKYSQVDGKIIVGYKRLKKCVNIQVKDEGPSIQEEDLPYIFERFYRGEKSRARTTGVRVLVYL